MKPDFVIELASLLNRHGVDTKLGTPDFILADVMIDALGMADKLTCRREAWFGRVSPENTLSEKLGILNEFLRDKK